MDDIVKMRETFLDVVRVKTEEDAITAAINAAVSTRGGGKFYATEDSRKRSALKDEWKKLLRQESQRYLRGEQVSEDQHCESISKIAETLSSKFKDCLSDERLRYGLYGPSQKAFNLYLKNLLCLGKIGLPPHCPVDGIVLGKAKIDGAWTMCRSRDEYMGWIATIRREAEPQGLSLSDWENKIWLEEDLKKNGKNPSSQCG